MLNCTSGMKYNPSQHMCVSTVQITSPVRDDMSKGMMTSLASLHMMKKRRDVVDLMVIYSPPATTGPPVGCFSFHGLGHWLSKIPFPGLTHYHCYMGSNGAIHSRRKPWNFPPKHTVNCSSVSVMSACEKSQTLTTSHLFKTDGLTESDTLCKKRPLVDEKCRAAA